ncbi:MAG: hypothetical protein KAJ32_05015, partial [Gammaproteobacteria bacterium]|nr:hypothetical protein [Gammaproteobacteria bacterium]
MDDLKKLINFVFNKISLTVLVSVLSISAISETFQLGDLAPRGAPDGQLNAADALILQRLILGEIAPIGDEIIIGDVVPLSAPDGLLNAGDLVVQQQAILGLINLGTVDTGLPAPTLDTVTSPTSQNPYLVSGSTSPNVTVDIYVNGVAQQQVVSDASGIFTSAVYLFDGDNQIQATASDVSGTSGLSVPVIVEYINTIDRNQGGTISTDTVWTADGPAGVDDPYLVTGTLTVDPGITLTIQPGARLQFSGGVSLSVNGTLLIQGTATAPVVLTSGASVPAAGDWSGIVINSSSVGSVLEHVEIAYAVDGVYIDTSDVTIRDCLIHHMSDDGIDMFLSD